MELNFYNKYITFNVSKNTLHLYSVAKKLFHSTLFRKEIKDSNPDYWPYIIAETLYRIKDMEIRNCSCFKCKEDLERLKEYADKIMAHKTE